MNYSYRFTHLQRDDRLTLSRKGLSEICNSLLQNDSVVVYNIEFVPREYLYESITQNVRQTLRQLAIRDKNVERSVAVIRTMWLLNSLSVAQANADSLGLPRHDLRVPTHRAQLCGSARCSGSLKRVACAQ